MSKPLLSVSYVTVALLVAVAGTRVPCRAAATDPAPAAAQAPDAAGANNAAAATPGGETTGTPDAAAAAAEATKTANNCKKAIAGFDSKPASLQSLPKEQLAQLLRGKGAANSITCLAIANGNRSYCDLLSDDPKKKCLSQYEQVSGLKGLPKEQMKGRVVHDMCMQGNMCDKCDKAECDKIEAAVNGGDAGKCAGLSAPVGAFCTALATRDAAKCQPVPQGEARSICEAFATEDAARCAKDSTDCRNVTNGFAAFRKDGLAGVQGIDPGVAAGVKGIGACQPLLADFEKLCMEGK